MYGQKITESYMIAHCNVFFHQVEIITELQIIYEPNAYLPPPF